jgi:serine/threonine protein kinase
MITDLLACSLDRDQILLEYCGLGSVQDAMNLLYVGDSREKQYEGMCEEDLAYILKCVVSGLVYLHSQKIIHRYHDTRSPAPQLIGRECSPALVHCLQRPQGSQHPADQRRRAQDRYPKRQPDPPHQLLQLLLTRKIVRAGDFGTASQLRTVSMAANAIMGTRA